MYRYEIDERTRTLKLCVRRQRGNKVLICSGCGGRCSQIEKIRQREVRDLAWRDYHTVVVVEFYLKESLDRLWTYRHEGAALRHLNQWIG